MHVGICIPIYSKFAPKRISVALKCYFKKCYRLKQNILS